MVIPDGMTEEQIVQEMQKVINILLKDITPFGFYNKEELKQQAFLYAVEAMNTSKYDNKRPLGGFLRTCIINRIISLSRDKYSRKEEPCKRCPFSDPNKKKSDSGCCAFSNKMQCEKYKAYFKRNQDKRNIMNLQSETPLFDVSVDYKAFTDVDNRDYVHFLSRSLSKTSKSTLSDLMDGKVIDPKKLDKLRTEVSEVIKKKEDNDRNREEEAICQN